MRRSRFRIYMAFFALLAFTSQSFAVVNSPCAGMAEMVMDHSGHAMADEADMDTVSCCDHDDCAQTDCVSASFSLITKPSEFIVPFANTLDTKYSVTYAIVQIPSLFRPPISR